VFIGIEVEMISKTGIHALKALAVLAELPEGEYLGAASIAERIDAPRNYLGKLLQTLARENLVEGQKGLNGGFRLAKDPRTITLQDVLEPIDHVSRWNGCFMGRKSCGGDHPCSVHDKWSSARNSYLDFLGGMTIEGIKEG
jgi:Rrf2 family protein